MKIRRYSVANEEFEILLNTDFPLPSILPPGSKYVRDTGTLFSLYQDQMMIKGQIAKVWIIPNN